MGRHVDVAPEVTIGVLVGLRNVANGRHGHHQQPLFKRNPLQFRLGFGGGERRGDVLDPLVLADRDPAGRHPVDEVDPIDLEVGVLAAALLVDPLEQPLSERPDGGSEQDRGRHVAVGCRRPEPDVERPELRAAAHPRPLWRTVEVRHRRRLGGLGHGLLGRNVDVLAKAGAIPVVEGDHGGRRRLGRCVEECLVERDPHRRSVGIAHEVQLHASADQGQVGGRPVGLGAGLTECTNRGVDKTGVVGHEIGRAQAHGRHRPDVGGLDDNVGGGRQPLQGGQIVFAGQIEGDASLAPVV